MNTTTKNSNSPATLADEAQPVTAAPEIGARVRMISENSNWEIGELGTVTGLFDGGTGTVDRVSVELDGREDDYTAFFDAFEVLQ